MTETRDIRDAAAVNQNNRALADAMRKTNADVRDLPTLAGDNSWTGVNTWGGTSKFNGVSTFTASEYHASPATFVSTLTINGGAFTTAARFDGIILGGWSIVSTKTVSAATSVAFTNLSSSFPIRLTINYIQNSANAVLDMTFNDDTGANYKYACYGVYTDGVGFASYGTGAVAIRLFNSGGGLGSGNYGAVTMIVYPNRRDQRITSTYTIWSGASVATAGECAGGGEYSGSAQLTKLTITPSAGTITGDIRAEVLAP
ncbi:MAG: hypothetical protein QME60_01260 [Verrucomicrobiota bacterium]|nr:hypothetical protein [Verrucomicrobiota bacterium]